MKAKMGTYVLAAGRRITDSATLITDLGMARSGKKKKSVIRVVVSVIGVI